MGQPAKTLSSEPMSTLTEGQRLGPYRIVRLLGEGGMGAVYEARQEPLDRRVALKTLHPEFAANNDALARFFNEAKVLSRLEHPSIVSVSDFGNAADGTTYLVMEYLRGQSLGGRLRQVVELGERLPLVTVLQIGFQIADVLAIAHAQHIVHRDIKPDNVMLITDAVAPGGERVKLLDFGIAKLTREKDRGGVKTASQAVMGTPSYMSPEQCAGAGGVDAKTDVYALGCVLYEMLAGRPPYVGEGAGQLIGMHLFQSPTSLLELAPKTPPTIAEIVHRFLTKEKAERPSMSVAADELGKLLAKHTSSAVVLRSRPIARTGSDAAAAPVLPSPVSTLGRSQGQMGTGVNRQALWFTAGVLVTIGVGWGFVVRTGTPSKGASQTAQSSPVAPQRAEVIPAPAASVTTATQPQLITWRIESEPSRSTILNADGKVQGMTPFSSTTRAESGEVVLHVHHDGYRDALVKLSRDRDASERVTLESLPAAVVKRAAPKSVVRLPATSSPPRQAAQPAQTAQPAPAVPAKINQYDL